MKTLYPDDPFKTYEEWREYIKRQVITANERRVIEQFKEDIAQAFGKKSKKS